MKICHWPWPRQRHHKLSPAYIRRMTVSFLYFERFENFIKEHTMSLAQLNWSLPAEDVNDAASVDVFDNGTAIGTVAANDNTFTTGDLAPGDHVFTVVVRSKAGAAFDSDPSNPAAVNVPVPVPVPTKLTAVSDLTAALA